MMPRRTFALEALAFRELINSEARVTGTAALKGLIRCLSPLSPLPTGCVWVWFDAFRLPFTPQNIGPIKGATTRY